MRRTSVSFWHYHIIIIVIIIIVVLLVTCVRSALRQTNIPNIRRRNQLSAAHVQLHSLWDWRVHIIILCIQYNVYINSDPKLILKFNHFSVSPSPIPGQYSKVRSRTHIRYSRWYTSARVLPPDSSLRDRKLFDRLNSDRPLSIAVLITLVLPPFLNVHPFVLR